MREIKFRAWDKDTGQMLTMPLRSHFGLGRFFGFIPEGAILMQYTGLKDKDGVEIYEGDILKIDGYSPKAIGIVVYYVSGFKVQDAHGSGYTFLNSHCEIVGNIHENPELLKE